MGETMKQKLECANEDVLSKERGVRPTNVRSNTIGKFESILVGQPPKANIFGLITQV